MPPGVRNSKEKSTSKLASKAGLMSETSKPIQFSLRFLFALTLAVAIFCSLVLVLVRHFRSVAPENRAGPVTDRAEWPYALQEFMRDALPEETNIEPAKVYCWQKFINHEHVWQHEWTPEVLEELIEHFDLKPVGADSRDAQMLRQRIPPSWPKPSEIGAAEYLARQPWVNGHDGSRCAVMVDREGETITVWYLFVF